MKANFQIVDAVFCSGAVPKLSKGVFKKPLPRRMSQQSCAVLHCVATLVQQRKDEILQFPLVYASRFGEMDRTHALFDEWKEYGEMSPAGFSLSVHNATASLLGLTSENHLYSTTLAAGEKTIAMGILEASLISKEYGTPCLLCYGDSHPGIEAAAIIIKHTESALNNIPESFSDLRNQWTKESLE